MSNNPDRNPGLIESADIVRIRILLLLVVTEIILCLLIFMFQADSKLIGDISAIVSSAAGVVLCWMVVSRQKTDGIFGVAYLLLAIGLTLWCIAEIIWTYYEIGLGKDNPFPSLADIFWIVGYVPILYFIFRICKLFGNLRLSNIIVVTLASIIFISFYLYDTISSSDISSYDN